MPPEPSVAGSAIKLPDSAHTSQSWRIHEFTGDFRLEDVWALPTRGDREDFPMLVEGFTCGRPGADALRSRPGALDDPLEGGGAARPG